jgi:hypothetical protein
MVNKPVNKPAVIRLEVSEHDAVSFHVEGCSNSIVALLLMAMDNIPGFKNACYNAALFYQIKSNVPPADVLAQYCALLEAANRSNNSEN